MQSLALGPHTATALSVPFRKTTCKESKTDCGEDTKGMAARGGGTLPGAEVAGMGRRGQSKQCEKAAHMPLTAMREHGRSRSTRRQQAVIHTRQGQRTKGKDAMDTGPVGCGCRPDNQHTGEVSWEEPAAPDPLAVPSPPASATRMPRRKTSSETAAPHSKFSPPPPPGSPRSDPLWLPTALHL